MGKISLDEFLNNHKNGVYKDVSSYRSALVDLGARDPDGLSISYFKMRNDNSSANSSSSSAIKSLSNSSGNIFKDGLKSLGDVAVATAYDKYDYDRIVKISDVQKLYNDVVNNGLNIISDLGTLAKFAANNIVGAMERSFQQQAKLLDAINTKGGMTGEIAKSFAEGVQDIVGPSQKLGITFDEIKDATETMLVNSQKFANYQGETIFNALKISAAYGQTAKSIIESTEKYRDVGISLSDSINIVEKVGRSSLSQGLSARATTKTISENLDKLNQYGFQNGVEGLGRMVQQAQALNFKMEETFKVAAKVFDPEGAISLSANLQVVGGAVGDLADPLKLMYDATNNVEGLQSGILKAAQSLATYNAEQGRFEVTGANLRRAKAMADALGISMEQLTSSAIKGQVQMQAMSQIDLFDLTDDQKNFVSNLASMKGGVVGFELPKNLQEKLGINQSFLDASSLTSTQVAKLAKAQEDLAKRTPEDIIRDQYTVATQQLNALNSIAINIGSLARKGLQGNDEFNKVNERILKSLGDVSDLSPDELGAKIQEQMNNVINPVLEQAKKGLKLIGGAVDDGIQGVKNFSNKTGVTEILQEAKKGTEELYDNTKKFVIEHLFTVNMNAGTPEMAEMLVGEFRRNPKALSDFTSLVTKDTKKFVQS